MSGHNVPPVGSPARQQGFLLPSPIPTRRSRTVSMSERAAEGPSYKGVVKTFCRERGHGFIHPDGEETTDIFVHISDIEDEYVLKEGDRVSYKMIHIPPKNEKFQAVHVQVIHHKSGVPHEKWDNSSPQKLSD